MALSPSLKVAVLGGWAFWIALAFVIVGLAGVAEWHYQFVEWLNYASSITHG